MTIPVSTIVDVSVSIGAVFPERAGFGTLNIVTPTENVYSPGELVRTYFNMEGVAEDWASTTEAYKAANAYFSQQPKPTTLKISERPSGGGGGGESRQAYMHGTPIHSSEISALIATSDGELSILVGANRVDITAMDFTIGDPSDMNTVISVMQSAIQAQGGDFSTVTVEWDAVGEFFTFRTNADNVEIGYIESPAVSAGGTDISAYTNTELGLGGTIYPPLLEGETQGTLTGGVIANPGQALIDLANMPAQANFIITIDGVSVEITSQNPIDEEDMDYVAIRLQETLQLANGNEGFQRSRVEYNPLTDQMLIISGTVGTLSTITPITVGTIPNGFIGPILNLDTVSGAIAVNGGIGGPGDITDALNAIQDYDPDWYGLVLTNESRDNQDVEDVADWVEARTKVFGNTSNNIDMLDAAIDTDIASVLKAKNLRRTITTYSSNADEYPSASILGRAFTVNFNQPNSTITLKFKQAPGITVETLTQNNKAVLDSKNANAIVEIGASILYAESSMANGVFFDEVHGVDWLSNAIQTNVFGYLLTRPTKVPYTDKGIAAIEQQVIRALDEGLRNGLIAPGETIDGEFLPSGYKVTTIPVDEINQSDKEARHYPGLSFIILGAGAIHSVQINAVFER